MHAQKPVFYHSIKHIERMFYCFSPHCLYIIKQMKKPNTVKIVYNGRPCEMAL